MTHRQRYQRQSDLFVPKTPLVPMTASERTKLLPLVSALFSGVERKSAGAVKPTRMTLAV